MEYIDVRGAWPVYFNGFIAVELIGEKRNITVQEARNINEVYQVIRKH